MSGSSRGILHHSQSTGSNRDGKSPIRHEESLFCTDADEFPRAVAKTAVAQICEAAGFQSIQLSALETLADIAIRYLSDTGKASQFYANIAGRTQSNALDVLCAVEDVNGDGLIHAHKAVATSDTPAELKRFVDYTEEIPFCKPMPHFPIRKKAASMPSFSQVGEKPPGGHIPPWLPAFPDVHTYKTTPMWNERKVDPRVDKLEQAKQRRKAERSLVSLHLRLCAMGASSSTETKSNPNFPQDTKLWGVPSMASLDNSNALKPEGVGNIDREGVKENSAGSLNGVTPSFPATNESKSDGPVALPSIFEAFAPALEAATLTVQETTGTGGLRGCLSISKTRMPPLTMTFDYGTKVNQTSTAAFLSLGGKAKKRVLPELKDDEKDEKKKRAEQILAQSLEASEMAPNDTRH